jgi:hypothetical protein
MKRRHSSLVILLILPLVLLACTRFSQRPADARAMTPFEGDPNEVVPPDSALNEFGFNNDYRFALFGSKVYATRRVVQGSDEPDPWRHFVTLPFKVKNPDKIVSFSSYNPLLYQFCRVSYLPTGTLLYQASEDSLYYYDIQKKTIDVTSFPAVLAQIDVNNITSIRFSKQSTGCFHGYESEVLYTLRGDHYQLESKTPYDTVRLFTLLPGPSNIDTAAAHAFARHVIQHNATQPTLGDLKLSAADFTQCKKDIIEFKQRKNKRDPDYDDFPRFSFDKEHIDYDRLVALVDRIDQVDPPTLKAALWEQGIRFHSTTSELIKIELTDRNNNVLEMTHHYYSTNPFSLPWQLTMRGAKTESMDWEITRFVQTYCPHLIPSTNKVPLLHTLVKKMYE